MKKPDEFIERRIVIGLIVSDEFIQKIRPIWEKNYVESTSGRLLASWCIDFFDMYGRAPNTEIASIFTDNIKKGLSEEQQTTINDILTDLSYEHTNSTLNVEYLIDQTKMYFKEKQLRFLSDSIANELNVGDISSAEKIVFEFYPQENGNTSIYTVNPLNDMECVEKAFSTQKNNLIHFPKALGVFWDDQFVKDSFIALMGPEKRGKTFMLLEITMRALMSNNNVVLFQAGDMSESQQIRRICNYISYNSDKEVNCAEMFEPVVDCWKNQTDTCNEIERECGFGIFPNGKDIKSVTMQELKKAYEEDPDYLACRNCEQLQGTPWIRKLSKTEPLTTKEAVANIQKWNSSHSVIFKLCTYPNETLSISEIKTLLNKWERSENFIPSVIVIDYADILTADEDCKKLDWRNQNNKIWQRLRRISQERHCCVVTATQAAATAYSKETIDISDFSEDKRKLAHVTAMYGLNQTLIEKQLGVLRMNELVVRDGAFNTNNQIAILQNLQRGRPYIGSYWVSR